MTRIQIDPKDHGKPGALDKAIERARGERGADKDRLDWLQEQIVDVIYLDDGTIIDVRGNSVREAIDTARSRKTK